jgi:hypoxanthine phosphoribosyltransferase
MELLSKQEKKLVRAHDLTFKPFLSEEKILKRVAELGHQITIDYKAKKPVFLSILNGAFVFLADLSRACDLTCETTFIKLSSYQGTKSTGNVTTLIGMDIDLKGRDVIVVEDIIDTGKTLYQFLKELKELEPSSIKLASLLVKPEALQHDIPVDYKGFDIPNKFVIGYGLDYNGEGRNLKSIYQLAE